MNTHQISLDEARQKLSEAFEDIDLSKHRRILVNAPTATGKTRAAAQLCLRAAKQGISSLVLVPLHALGKEWGEHLQETGLPGRQVAQLYGPTYPQVDCLHIFKAKQYLAEGQNRIFQQLCCNQKRCRQYHNCLHINSRKKAERAKVLIATHSHLAYPDFCLKAYNNQDRQLFIIDELIELSRQTKFTRRELRQLYMALEWTPTNRREIESEELFQERRRQLQQLVEGLLRSHRDRSAYPLPDLAISDNIAAHLHNYINRYYHQHWDNKIHRNVLASLIRLTSSTQPTELKYSWAQDSLVANWVPRFPPNSTVIILSASTKLDYLNQYYRSQFPDNRFQLLDQRMNQWNVDYDWVKVIQMVSVQGGRNRLMFDKNLRENVEQSINCILTKHHDPARIALVCAKGAKVRAKQQFIRWLNPIFQRHNRQLISVEADDLFQQKLPDGREQVPVIHYGVIGVNSLDHDNVHYDVVVELTGFYISSNDFTQQLETIDYDQPLELKVVKENKTFHLLEGGSIEVVRNQYQVEGYPHSPKWLELVREVKESGEISQTEGRFFRKGRDTEIIIYRFHNVNIRPYPASDCYYKSWQTFRFQEFGKQLISWLKDPEIKDRKVRKWRRLLRHLQKKVKSPTQIFTYQDMEPVVSSNHGRGIQGLIDAGLIDGSDETGGKGRGKKRKLKLPYQTAELKLPSDEM